MKPYGVPRILDAEFPDVADIQLFGFSSKHGVRQRPDNKARSRRIWKKKARRDAKKEFMEE